MDVREAAKALGVHTQTIYNMLYDGRLPANKTETNAWNIPYSSIRKVLGEAEKRFEKEVEIIKATEVLEEFYEKKLIASKEFLY
ncbi:helix-turn-helix domain-containing protein, partial [Bacillus paralicheniformis]